MKKNIKPFLVFVLSINLFSCAEYETLFETSKCSKIALKECQTTLSGNKDFCAAVLNSVKECVAAELTAKAPFYKDEFRIGINATPLYFPESILPKQVVSLYLPRDIDPHSPLGKELGDTKISENRLNSRISTYYAVEQCISDINSTIYNINYHKKLFDIAVSPNKRHTDYTSEIQRLSENMKELAEIGKTLKELSENYLAFADSTEGPKNRSSQLLMAAGKDPFKKTVAEELIISDDQRLALISELRRKLTALESATEVAGSNFSDLYRKSRERAVQQQIAHEKRNQATNGRSKNIIANQPSPTEEESYPEGTFKLPQGSVICTSKELYSTQLKLVTAGERSLIDGCGLSNKNYKIIMLDLNVFSASKILIVENKMTVWTDATFLKEGGTSE